MVKIFFIIVLMMQSLSYKDIDKNLLNVCKDIIENPKKIYDLKNNFPSYYVDEYINKEMKDTNILKFLNHYTDSLFNRNIDSIINNKILYTKIVDETISENSYKENYYDKINKEIRDRAKIYNINFWKNHDFGLGFEFIKDGDKYYFYQISKLIEAKL